MGFNKAFDHIILVEGGYSDNPLDSGGKTKYGVTESLARKYGYTGRMSDLSLDKARAIYKSHFWDAMMLDEVCEVAPKVALEMFDTGVNMGVGRAVKFLQRSLNVLNNRESYHNDITADGIMGNNTLKSLNSIVGVRGEDVLDKMLNCLQGAFYVRLAEQREKDEAFIYGWFKNRVS